MGSTKDTDHKGGAQKRPDLASKDADNRKGDQTDPEAASDAAPDTEQKQLVVPIRP